MSNELIARLEAATADHQRELLFEAFEAVHPYPGHEHYLVDEIDWTWDRLRQRFAAMVAAEAYESAALTLVPEGGTAVFHLFNHRDGFWECDLGSTGPDFRGQAATPALAIAAATLRAKDTTHD